MNSLKLLACAALLTGLLATAEKPDVSPAADPEQPSSKAAAEPPKIQLAILLDTSGSMDGLIEQAKTQLWKIVNEFTRVKRDGHRPQLEVALYEYGKSSLNAQEGYLRMLQPLTMDLDKLSEELFGLRTNGGDEFCGWVIKAAVEGLDWSRAPGDFKAVFIAGNEPFTQGPVDYRVACKMAIQKGIIVNTIHCGAEQEGINSKWQEGALLADGTYLHMDHNQAVVHYQAPQDKELVKLGEQLNRTYVAFGDYGRDGLERQNAQDRNAFSAAPAVAAERATAKASLNYRNPRWDLVDAVKEGAIKLEDLPAAQLPEDLKKLDLSQLKRHIEAKAREREMLREKIRVLTEARNKNIAEQQRQSSQTNTLDSAIVSAVREQAAKKMYR